MNTKNAQIRGTGEEEEEERGVVWKRTQELEQRETVEVSEAKVGEPSRAIGTVRVVVVVRYRRPEEGVGRRSGVK